ncbi:DUF3152 domain-containing protein [Streptomyces sp. t39]|uniref:DUF3152 domain-containing protein n=1 Tax=Streptomyces sp. t39 TaxID=1828156 RepID=UPI0021C7A0B0|nr:DUF3152 domain-containing protein [Streptomyces sp. t39]
MGKRAATSAGRGRRDAGPNRSAEGSAASRPGTRKRPSPRRPLRGFLVLGVLVGVLSTAGGAALAHWHSAAPVTGAAGPRPEVTAAPLISPGGEPAPEPPSSRPPSPRSAASPSPKPSAKPSPTVSPEAVRPPRVPVSGPGTFTAAGAAGKPSGAGALRRYRVEVENGIDVSAGQAAAEIQEILAHPRGWAANGRGRFQLVTSGADFVIRIATPDTADRLCRAQGLDTGGELNCETTDGVVVNLRRWLLGSPTFAGTPAEYRHLIINHEVGHEIGIRRHLGCPGPGRPAPVMMQQIKGLDGCRSNAWPYAEDGTYLTGPPA